MCETTLIHPAPLPVDGLSTAVRNAWAGPACTESPLDVAAVASAVESLQVGALLTFAGTVRDHNRGKRVLHLRYEAYPEMVERIFDRIAAEVDARWRGTRVAMQHRIGLCQPGEVSVVVVVASAHRAAAFDACRYAVERLKADAPVWKHETDVDGAVWIGAGS